MASDINQIIDPKLIAELERLNKLLIESGNNMDKVLPVIDKLTKAQNELSKSVNKDKEAQEKLNAIRKETESINKRILATDAKISQAATLQNKKLLLLQEQQRKQLDLLKAEAKVKAAANSSNEKLAATILLYEKRLKSVNRETEKGKAEAQKLTDAINRMNEKLTKQSSDLVKTKRNVGNYRQSLDGLNVKISDLARQQNALDLSTKKGRDEYKRLAIQINQTKATINNYKTSVQNTTTVTNNFGSSAKRLAMQFAGALGLTSLVFMFVNVLKGSFNTIREFTKQNAILAGVLGKQRKEVKELTNQAIALGAIYPVTATEVNKLQVAYARLGFTQSEIINLTEATVLGSISLNSSLDQTATLVGAIVKAFGDLSTMDSALIIDQLTAATQKSSLSFMSLETGIPKVAGAANALGVELSTMLAQLGVAHDATLDASVASTSLRNIYLELSNRGIDLSTALGMINTSQDKLNASYKLFGKRGAIVGLALAENIELTHTMTKEIDAAGGTSKRVAEEQMATLDGAIKGLSSAWEKFILSFKSSEGIMSAVVGSATLALNTFFNKDIPAWRRAFEISTLGIWALASNEQKKIDALTKNLSTARKKDIEFTIKKNEEQLKNGTKVDRLLLKMLKDRLSEMQKMEDEAAKTSAQREEMASQEAELVKIAAQDALLEKQKKAHEDYAKELENLYKQLDNEILMNTEISFDNMLDRMFDNLTKKHKSVKQEMRDTMFEFALADEKEVDEGNDKAIAKFNDGEQEKLDKMQEYYDTKKKKEDEVKKESIQAGIELGNTLFSLQNNRLQREFDAAKDNADLQNEIKAKMAKNDKKKALFDIAVNTAVAIVKALPNIPLSIIVGGMGLVQAGAVAAQPIPQFAKGTNYAPGGMALVGEQGRELIKSPSGRISLAENPALINLERGSKVIPNAKTEAILNDKRMVAELKLTRKAIQRLPRVKSESQFTKRQRGYYDGFLASKHRFN